MVAGNRLYVRLASTDFFEPRDFYVIVRKDQKALLDEINYGIKHLEPSIKLEQQANKARREFLCNMSHDIRMPMNAIIGFTDIAKQQTQDADTMGCLEKISSSSKHLLDLINNVLDISRIESGTDENKPVSAERPEGARIPIIAMTANAFVEDVEAARAVGMDAHLAKPIDMDEVLQTLRRCLQKRK